jgi:hypothetical protein
MRAETEYLEEIAEIDIGSVGGQRQADIFLDRPPRQQSRFLKYDPQTPGAWGAELAAEIRIQPGGNFENRGLAATGRADQRAKRSGVEPQFQTPNHFHQRAIGGHKALGLDAKLKRSGVSSGLRVVQAVAPRGFR